MLNLWSNSSGFVGWSAVLSMNSAARMYPLPAFTTLDGRMGMRDQASGLNKLPDYPVIPINDESA